MKDKNSDTVKKILNNILRQSDKDNKSETIRHIEIIKREFRLKGISIPKGFSPQSCYRKINKKSLIDRKIRSDKFSQRSVSLNKYWEKYKEFVLTIYSQNPSISIHKLAELVNEYAVQNNYDTVKITTLSRHIRELVRISSNFTQKSKEPNPENIFKIFIVNSYKYFFANKSNVQIGKIIEFANLESTFEKKAEKFFSLLRDKGVNA